jgi:SAM-dependent methyltransferase
MKSTTREIVHDFCGRHLSGAVLDVGAGTAKYQEFIKARSNSYLTLDIVEGADIVADAKAIPFDDGKFDTVLSFQMLEHVDEPSKVISEMFRILKTGGKVIVTAPFMVPVHSDPYDFRRFTKEGLAFELRRAGFKIIESESYGGLFGTLLELFKFVFFSPYEHHKNSIRMRIGRPILKYLGVMSSILDSKFSPNTVYTNVAIIGLKS